MKEEIRNDFSVNLMFMGDQKIINQNDILKNVLLWCQFSCVGEQSIKTGENWFGFV